MQYGANTELASEGAFQNFEHNWECPSKLRVQLPIVKEKRPLPDQRLQTGRKPRLASSRELLDRKLAWFPSLDIV